MIYLCWVLGLMVLISCIYLMLGWVTVRHFSKACQRAQEADPSWADIKLMHGTSNGLMWPDVVQLKPFHQFNPRLASCLNSFICQDYPGKQRAIFISSQPIEGFALDKLAVSRDVPLSWSVGSVEGTNRKIAAVAAVQDELQELFVVLSDADMIASPDLLCRVMQPFADENVGMSTCLYIVREAKSWGDVWEGINVADFAASVLVARQVEGISFGLGAVMAMRRELVDKLGGWAAFKDYLADDYQLGNQIHGLGYKVVLADTVVEDVLEGSTFWEYFTHQLRWMRTYRCNRPGGFFAYIITQGMFWALLLLIASAGAWWAWLVVLGWMLVRAWWCTSVWKRLGGRRVALYGLLSGLKDIMYVVLWLSAFCGSKVQWGNELFKVGRDGRMVKVGEVKS